MEKAVPYYIECLAYKRKKNDPRELGTALIGLGNAYRFQGRLSDAVEHYSEALRVLEPEDDDRLLGPAYANLSAAFDEMASYFTANSQEEAATEFRDAALSSAREASRRLTQAHLPLDLQVMLLHQGRLEEHVGDLRVARQCYARAFMLYEDVRSNLSQRHHKEHVLGKMVDLFSRAIGVSLRLFEADANNVIYVHEAFAYSEAAKARLLLDIIGEHAERSSEEQAHPTVEGSEGGGIEAEDVNMNDGADVAGVSGFADCGNAFGHRTPVKQVIQATSFRSLNYDAVRKSLPEDTALLEYVYLSHLDKWYLFVLTQHGSLEKPIVLRGGDVADASRRFHEALFGMERNLAPLRLVGAEKEYVNILRMYHDDIQTLLGELGRIVIPTELVRQLKENNIRRLLLIPEGVLFNIPFAGLRINVNGRNVSLIGDPGYEKLGFEVCCATSASAFDRCRQKMARRTGSVGRGQMTALLVSDPNHDHPDLGLPEVSTHVEDIRAELFPAGHCVHLSKEAATKDGFRRHMASANVGLFFGHGTYNFENPLNAALCFSGSRLGGAEVVDLLTVREIIDWPSDARFDSCSLLVLASCWGLRVDSMTNQRAREIVGLVSAFLQRGVGSVIGALWPATVGASCEILRRFFEAYLAGGDASRALRSAQLAYRKEAPPEWDNPYFWAPFYLMGDYKAWP